MDWIRQNMVAAAGIAIVVIGLLGIGWNDVVRFRLRRVMAVASVNFRQSIRRRVLLLTPLVMIGIVIVSGLQRSLDAQDAVRQTTTYCLFATGLLIVLVTIILACTNLPKEIESRVIYTVATKPVTRLEIVVGKVVGFAGVTLCILLIMGAFTWSYLAFKDWNARRVIAQQLDAGTADPISRPTLTYYRDHGTLHARQYAFPTGLQVFAHLPQHENDIWAAPSGEGEIMVRFSLNRQRDLAPPASNNPNAGSAWVGLRINLREVEVAKRLFSSEPTTNPVLPTADAATTQPVTQPTTQASTQPAPNVPRVHVNLYNNQREFIVASSELGGGERGFEIPADGIVRVAIRPEHLEKLIPYAAGEGEFMVNVVGVQEMEDREIQLEDAILLSQETGFRAGPTGVAYAGRMGQYGQQLRGRSENSERIALYAFENIPLPSGTEKYTFELRSGIESDRTEVDEEDDATIVDVVLRNEKGSFGPFTIYPESQRPTYFEVPAAAVAGGNFHALLRVRSRVFLGLRWGPTASLKLVLQNQPFAYNLAKSLTVLWLLSLLVIIVSVFCSTFVSWPIAFVLTLLILGGRWMAQQIGDIAQPGVGRSIFTQLVGTGSAGAARAFSETMDALVGMLNVLSSVLPDISKFSAIEAIEKGMAIVPADVLLPSLWVTLGFGVPLLVLSYVFLKYKEVAP